QADVGRKTPRAAHPVPRPARGLADIANFAPALHEHSASPAFRSPQNTKGESVGCWQHLVRQSVDDRLRLGARAWCFVRASQSGKISRLTRYPVVLARTNVLA